MIKSAEEFVRLRHSNIPAEYTRAATEEAPLEVWYSILENFPEMARWVVHNKTVPVEVLSSLLNHSDVDIRWWIAQKRKLSHEMFLTLSQDVNEGVRERIAYNPKTPDEILALLVRDPSPDIAGKAKQRLGIL